MTLEFLFHPERASRLIEQKSLDAKNLGLEEVIDQTIANTINKENKDPYIAEVQNAINYRVLYYMMNLAASNKVNSQVNAICNYKLKELKQNLTTKKGVFASEMIKRIDNFNAHPEQFKVIHVADIPDGSPIGMDCFY